MGHGQRMQAEVLDLLLQETVYPCLSLVDHTVVGAYWLLSVAIRSSIWENSSRELLFSHCR